MGNFKHQSIRTTDRDRDAEKEQDRERVKEGQERLRNASTDLAYTTHSIKCYRSSCLTSMTAIAVPCRLYLRCEPRTESWPLILLTLLREPLPRDTRQSHHVQVTRGILKGRRTGSPMKIGEEVCFTKCLFHDTWVTDLIVAGADQSRTGRDRTHYSGVLDQTLTFWTGTENGRRDRDDRERPRSRVRDSSRSRREGSPSRRDKEDRRLDRDDGYSLRRDKDDRDRDFERDSELEDPRRWRDDGKRDERMAARRERETRERERELRDRRDRPAWDAGDRSDRRWAAGDDRDSRGKRSSGKDRRVGEDGKDRDDRKDREREKEPAWMDTYIPSSGSGGVIGGHRPGELDGIQAFRKEMQQKDKSNSPVTAGPAASQTQGSSPGQASENQLDEIQLFRLMMKREEEKKKSDSPAAPPAVHPATESTSTDLNDDGSQGALQNFSEFIHIYRSSSSCISGSGHKFGAVTCFVKRRYFPYVILRRTARSLCYRRCDCRCTNIDCIHPASTNHYIIGSQ